MRALKFDQNAWDDYLYWQTHDKAMVKRANALIKEVLRQPYTGTGKPEALKHDLAGWWSRRLSTEHRMVYRVVDDAAGGVVEIAALRYHY
jgi:toxin YoeB